MIIAESPLNPVKYLDFVPLALLFPGIIMAPDDIAHRECPPVLVIGREPEARGSYNMALDEVLFESVAGVGRHIWRLYLWNPAAVSIGRNQKVRETVNLEFLKREEIDMVRRPTGGRAIWHRGDVCFTHCGISPTEGESMSAFKDDYIRTAETLIRLLAELGIEAHISSGHASSGVVRGDFKSPCFMSSGRYEITIGAKKIAGIAQYRSGGRFLIQGSIRLSRIDPKNEELFFTRRGVDGALFREFSDSVSSIEEELRQKIGWERLRDAFMSALSVSNGDVVREENPGSMFDLGSIARLEREKYAKSSWNERF